MNHLTLSGICCLLLLLFGCSSPPAINKQTEEDRYKKEKKRFDNYNVTSTGLKYKIHSHGNGQNLDTGDIVEIHYAGSLLDGSEFDNSYKRKQPFSFKIGDSQVIAGWDEGIALLKIGDKATLYIPASLAYGKLEKPGIPANSDLIFKVEPLKRFPPPTPLDITGYTKQTTPSGLAYYLIKKTKKENILLGDTIKVHYTGYLPNGKIFDSSVQKGEPIEFIYKKESVIKGWMEALTILKKGEKGKFIVPPHLAYGEAGYTIIPPNATLVFDIELLE